MASDDFEGISDKDNVAELFLDEATIFSEWKKPHER